MKFVIKPYKEKTNRIHDSKIKDRVFNVGDRVLLFNSRLKIFSSMLKTHWSGPFTITEVFPYGTVELSQTDMPNFKVKPMSHPKNLTQISQCHVGNPLKPHWLMKHGIEFKGKDRLTWGLSCMDGYDEFSSSLTLETHVLNSSEKKHKEKKAQDLEL
nr:reverse transcriptase domain-containing protein [Tanacetum cinerariifolium]